MELQMDLNQNAYPLTIQTSQSTPTTNDSSNDVAAGLFPNTAVLSTNVDGKPHICSFCNVGFARRGNLKAHIQTHLGQKPFKCVDCNLSFTRKYNLEKHILTHAGIKPYKCKCGASYTRKRYLDVHIKRAIHTAAAGGDGGQGSAAQAIEQQNKHQPLLPILKTRFLQAAAPVVKKPDPSKPFICPACFAAFKKKSNLTEHLRGHSGVKPHKCSYPSCGASFAKKGNLKSHEMIHSGEKPFCCPICPASFARKYNLTKHVERHGKKSNVKLEDHNRTIGAIRGQDGGSQGQSAEQSGSQVQTDVMNVGQNPSGGHKSVNVIQRRVKVVEESQGQIGQTSDQKQVKFIAQQQDIDQNLGQSQLKVSEYVVCLTPGSSMVEVPVIEQRSDIADNLNNSGVKLCPGGYLSAPNPEQGNNNNPGLKLYSSIVPIPSQSGDGKLRLVVYAAGVLTPQNPITDQHGISTMVPQEDDEAVPTSVPTQYFPSPSFTIQSETSNQNDIIHENQNEAKNKHFDASQIGANVSGTTADSLSQNAMINFSHDNVPASFIPTGNKVNLQVYSAGVLTPQNDATDQQSMENLSSVLTSTNQIPVQTNSNISNTITSMYSAGFTGAPSSNTGVNVPRQIRGHNFIYTQTSGSLSENSNDSV